MKFIRDFTRGHPAIVSTLHLWLVFFACAGLAALLIAALQRADEVLWRAAVPIASTTASTPQYPPPMPLRASAPTP